MVKKSFRKKIVTNVTKTMAIASAVTMMAGVPAFAAGSYSTDISGTKTTTFDKYLVMDKDANVPNASFNFAVTAGNAKSYTVEDKKFEILAGVDADKITVTGTGENVIAYNQGDATLEDENALVKNYDSATEKYAKKTATLDFSACQFTEPGIYRYVITESGTNQGITNDADATRIVDVYVEDASDADGMKLNIAGYVLHSSTDDEPDVEMGENGGPAGSYTATKSQGFTNEYDTSDLTVRKEVSGNQASHDKYFEFTVSITDAVPGTVYNVDLSKADAVSEVNAATIDANEGKINPSSLTVGQDGTVTQKFYLQHGQEIRLEGLSKDTGYTVTENAEDYKSTAAGVSGYTDATNGTVTSGDVKTSYLNTREGIIPTGVVMKVGPFAAVTLIAGVGAVTIMMKNKKKA